MSSKQIKCGKYLNNWEVINVNTIRDITVFPPIAQIGEIDGKKDDISAKTNAYSVEIPFDDPFKGEDYLVAEIEHDDEIIKIGIVPVEFEDE